jgi:hypothetical protein
LEPAVTPGVTFPPTAVPEVTEAVIPNTSEPTATATTVLLEATAELTPEPLPEATES